MSGLAGFAFAADPADAEARLRRAAAAFSGPSHDVRTWHDEDFAVVVSSRFESAKSSTSFGDVCANGAQVLACEGYVVDQPPLSHGHELEDAPRARILLELYRRLGNELFPRLGGGFSLAVWDRGERRLVLYVSKFGQRQLYHLEHGEALGFSTEVKALPPLSRELLAPDRSGLANNLLGGLNYGTGTCFRNVRRLFQGTGMSVTRQARTTFSPGLVEPDLKKSTLPAPELAEELDRLLCQAVSRLSGVGGRRGVLLSSGVDSTLVGALVGKLGPGLRTFTQALPGQDETETAARIAAHLGSDHRGVAYDDAGLDLVAELTRQVEVVEEPSWAQFGLAMISLMDQVHDRADVFFHGTSADMIFGSPAHEQFDPARADEVAAYAPQAFDPEVMRHFVSNPEERREDFVDVIRAQLPRGAFDRLSYGQLMSVSRDTISPGAYLCQRFGVEAVCPYLDDDVVRFSFTLPDRMKMDEGRPKPLLRRVLDGYVPPGLVPETKVGYWVDALRDSYERDRLGPALELLAEKRTRERGLYNPKFLDQLIARYRGREVRAGWHRILWQILACEIFCRHFFDPKETP